MKLFFLLFVSLAAASWFPPMSDESCAFTRDDTFKCLEKYVDTNPHDQQITNAEIDAALSKYLPTYLKPVLWWIGTDGIMKDCDYDKNGVITPRDWMLAQHTCLAEKKNQCTMAWFCDRAKNE